MAYTPENNPYIPGDPYSYDLKWVVSNIKDLIANYTGQMDELKAYIQNYIDSMNLTPKIEEELQRMYDNGDFDAMIASFITDNKVLLVDTDQSSIFTEAEKNTARKNIMAGGSNPNLFMNPWFTVNQRNVSGYLSDGYQFDRWKVRANGGTVNYNRSTGYVTLSATANLAYIQQILEPKLREELNGRTVTFSVLTSANVVHSVTFVYDATATDMGIRFPTFPQAGYWYGADYSSCLQVIYGNRTVTLSIKAIKLELGSVSTIANDMPPDYGEELAKCQRYFVRIPKQVNQPYGFGFAQSNSSVRIAIPIPATMRDVPTISYTDSFTVRGGGSSLPSSSVNVMTSAPIGFVNLDFAVSGATQNQVYVLSSTDLSYIDLSADL